MKWRGLRGEYKIEKEEYILQLGYDEFCNDKNPLNTDLACVTRHATPRKLIACD